MLPALCAAMAANEPVSRFGESSGCGRRWRGRSPLGFSAASWQHQCRDCGTLNLSGRCGAGFQPRRRRAAANRQVGGVVGSAVAEGAAGGRRLRGR